LSNRDTDTRSIRSLSVSPRMPASDIVESLSIRCSSRSSARPPRAAALCSDRLGVVWLRAHIACTCSMHNAHAHARHTRHKAHAHDTTAHAHLVCDCRHTQAARALTRHVRSHSSLRSRRPNSPSSGLLATRTTHAPHAPPTPPRMDTRTHHVHVLTHRLGVAWEKRPADSTLVRVRQGFTIRSRQVAPSSAPSGCSAAHRSMSGPRTDIDVWTQMTCTHTSPPPPHTHAPTNIASHRQAITPSAVASADQAGSRPGGSSYAPPPSSDGVLLCDGRLSAIDLAEPLVDP
jgi:hypothetical protein